MSDELQKTLCSDLALAALDEKLICQAQELYGLGFSQRITPSQMAALGEIIRRAASIEEAKNTVKEYLRHQLEKLERKAGRRCGFHRGKPPTKRTLP